MKFIALFSCLMLMTRVSSSQKTHSVTFGRWTTVKMSAEEEGEGVKERLRALLVDGRAKELTFGPAHDVTDRIFVVQRAFRLNDSLPQESGATRWRWERGSWLLVNRNSGRVQALSMPDFEPDASAVSWFRDYAAYCGASEDGQKALAIVAQIGKRKPLLKKELAGGTVCASPIWQRDPLRVTFEPPDEAKFGYEIKSHAVDLVSADDEEAGEQ